MTLPVLTAATIETARDWGAHELLIVEQASGTQLIQLLRSEDPHGVPSPVARRPEADKVSPRLGHCSYY